MNADAAVLKFRNYILSMDDNRLPKILYNELMKDTRGCGHRKNSVVTCFEPLAEKAQWNLVIGKYAAKEAARRYILKEQNKLFKEELIKKSTLVELKNGWMLLLRPLQSIY